MTPTRRRQLGPGMLALAMGPGIWDDDAEVPQVFRVMPISKGIFAPRLVEVAARYFGAGQIGVDYERGEIWMTETLAHQVIQEYTDAQTGP